jgi:hypothetical protein
MASVRRWWSDALIRTSRDELLFGKANVSSTARWLFSCRRAAAIVMEDFETPGVSLRAPLKAASSRTGQFLDTSPVAAVECGELRPKRGDPTPTARLSRRYAPREHVLPNNGPRQYDPF